MGSGVAMNRFTIESASTEVFVMVLMVVKAAVCSLQLLQSTVNPSLLCKDAVITSKLKSEQKLLLRYS